MLTGSEIAAAWAPVPVFEIAALVLGLIVGSFANVCIHRVPLGRSVVTPPSRCPNEGCGALIRPWDNIPVLSYLLLRGRCRACRGRISARYPLVEAGNGLAWAALAAMHGPTLRALAPMVLVTILIVLSLIDLDHQLLPDVITLPAIALGLLASFLPGSSVAPLAAAASALGGYLAFALVAKTYEKTRGVEGLGQGDWKMAALLGAFLGWQGMLLTVLVASLLGTAVGLGLIALGRGSFRHTRVPFGTFLGAASLVTLFVGGPVLDWYRGLFR